MARFLFVTLPVTGHVSPTLPLAAKLLERDHEVLWYCGKRFEQQITGCGAIFKSYRHAQDIPGDKLNEYYPERANLKGLAQSKWDMKMLIDVAVDQCRDLEEILQSFPADVVLGDMLSISVDFVSEKFGLPYAILNVMNLFMPSRDTAPDGLGIAPNASRVGRIRNRVLNWLVFRVLFRDVNKHMNVRRSQLGIETVSDSLFDVPFNRSQLFLQPTIPAFEYPRSDLPGHVHFIGALLPPSSNSFAPPEWWPELSSDRQVVLETQGTVANDARALLMPSIRGLMKEDVLVVATVGDQDVDTLGFNPLPDNVHLEKYIPYDQLMPFVDVMITNGGYGGTHFALTHGVPIVAGGQTEDKAEVCARIAWSGVGINLKTETPTAEAVQQAVRKVRNDPGFKARARALQAEFANCDAPTMAAELLEGLL
jgi:MGT family glycosyltransferase